MRTPDAKTAAALLAITLIQVSHASEHLGNNQRSGYTDVAVPAEPALLWTYQERHVPRTAWPEPFGELQFIDFDYSDQVTVSGGLVVFGSSADHTVRALDAGSGEEQWVFYTEGPVRFAPVAYRNRLYLVSDDGQLYCLNADTGEVIWKNVPAKGTDDAPGFRFNADFTPVTGTDRPWIYSSGLSGEIELKIMGTEEKK